VLILGVIYLVAVSLYL